ncbi:MAG: acyl-ACP--UDP-N-acetylglucosamine O-acyltransferase [Deltaproteobacteria bacterium]|nr:acyl-ACP--UDP-N-acetylglucosamine O-acyltransferase [Deltaproteobacteria bacterium]
MLETTWIHPTAVIHPGAVVGSRTRVGPYCVIGEGAVIGDECDIQDHVVIRGRVHIGSAVKIFPFCVLGGEPQHLKYAGEPTSVEIGNRVVLREYVTIHRGTSFGNQVTKVGDEAYIMAYTHIAHDCTVGRNVIIANASQLAGHSTVEDHATLGGMTALVQFCRVGRYCYVGGVSALRKDLLPFMTGKGNPFEVQGINIVGLTRLGFSNVTIERLKKIYKIFYLKGLTINQAMDKLQFELGNSDESKIFVDFVLASKAGIIR